METIPVPHAQDITYRHLEQMCAGCFWHLVGKDVDNTVFQPDQPFIIGQANRSRRVGFGQGLEAMPDARSIGRPPAFGSDLAMPDDHQTVHLSATGFERIKKALDVTAGKTDRLWCHSFKRLPYPFVFLSTYALNTPALSRLNE